LHNSLRRRVTYLKLQVAMKSSEGSGEPFHPSEFTPLASFSEEQNKWQGKALEEQDDALGFLDSDQLQMIGDLEKSELEFQEQVCFTVHMAACQNFLNHLISKSTIVGMIALALPTAFGETHDEQANFFQHKSDGHDLDRDPTGDSDIVINQLPESPPGDGAVIQVLSDWATYKKFKDHDAFSLARLGKRLLDQKHNAAAAAAGQDKNEAEIHDSLIDFLNYASRLHAVQVDLAQLLVVLWTRNPGCDEFMDKKRFFAQELVTSARNCQESITNLEAVDHVTFDADTVCFPTLLRGGQITGLVSNGDDHTASARSNPDNGTGSGSELDKQDTGDADPHTTSDTNTVEGCEQGEVDAAEESAADNNDDADKDDEGSDTLSVENDLVKTFTIMALSFSPSRRPCVSEGERLCVCASSCA
jgi:hypothetical protein